MYLSHQQRESKGLVINSSHEVDLRTKKKLYSVLVFMMILLSGVYGIEQYIESHQVASTYEPSHDIILWTKPENYTYEVEIAFYGNGQDAISEQNRVAHTSITVRPDMSETIKSALYTLPYTQSIYWIRVGFGYELAEDEWEWAYTSGILKLGVELRVNLEGHEVTMLVTPAQ